MPRQDWTDEKLFFRLLNNKSDKTYLENIRVLRSRPSKAVFNQCIALAHSNNVKHKCIGIDILAQLGGGHSSPRLFQNETIQLCFELLEHEKEIDVLSKVLYCIGHANSHDLTQPQVDKLATFKTHPNHNVRDGLVFSLLGQEHIGAIQILIYLSKDKNTNVKNWATFGLGRQIEIDNEEIRNALWARVDDKHEETRFEAITGLCIRKDPRAKALIENELSKRENGTLLFEAITELGDKTFIPTLKELLNKSIQEGDINPEWLKELRDCIEELEELKDN